MKNKTLTFLLCSLPWGGLMAQTSIHDGTVPSPASDPDASAMLDVQATNKGVLVPRVNIANLATAAPVTAPAEGLLVYNTNGTTGQGYYYWNGTLWVRLMSGNTPPLLTEVDPTWSGAANTTSAISRTGTVTVSDRLTLNSAGFDQHLLIQRTGAPDGRFATSTGGWVAIWPGVSGDNGTKGIRLNNTGTVQLMNYTTNGIVRTTGGTGTLTSGGAINLTTEVTGILPIANGGTGSATQGWVDLTTAQTAAGNKTWTGVASFSNVTPIRVANGTAALPALAFTSDVNTGLYSGGADILSFSTAGTERLSILANGTLRHKNFLMSSGPNYNSTWMMFDEHVNGNSLLLGSGGLTAIGSGESMGPLRANVAASTETLYLASDGAVNVVTGLQSGWATRVDAMLIAANGTLRLPTYTTNGIMRTTGGNGTVSSTGGAINLTTEVTGILPIANGGTGSATQGWVDLTTAQTAAGNKTWTGVASFSNVTPIRVANGTAALPALAFTSDVNTGLYSGGADILSFSTAGTERMRIAANGTVQIGVQNPTTTTATALTIRRTFTNANGTRNGIDNQMTAAPGTLLTAAREHRAVYNVLTNNLTATDLAGFSYTGYGAYNYMANPAGYTITTQVGGINYAYNISGGVAVTVRGAYNYGRNRGVGTANLQGGYNYAQQDLAAATTTNSYGAYNYALTSNGSATNMYGSYNYAYLSAAAASSNGMFGAYNYARYRGGGTIANMRGSYNYVHADANSGTVTNAYAVQAQITRASTQTISNGYLFYGSYSGTVGTKWGMYITGEDKNYFSNNVGIGQLTPTYNLHVNGRIGTNAINETSDARLKTDVTDLSDALDKVLAMRGVNYRWRTDEFPDMKLDSTLQFGLIAQELEQVVPELVSTDSEGWKSIEYSHIVPLLIEALKEQQQVISGQTDEMEGLKSQNMEQEERLRMLENQFRTLTGDRHEQVLTRKKDSGISTMTR